MNKRIRREDLFKKLNIPLRIPEDFQAVYYDVQIDNRSGTPIGEYDVIIIPQRSDRKRGGRMHRVFIVCRTCRKHVPFGRLDQHRCRS